MGGKNILPLYQSDLKKTTDEATSSSNVNQVKEVEIVVRFASTLPDVVIPVSLANTMDVSTNFIRQEIRRQRPKETYGKRLKMIHNGKVLMNHTNLQKEIKQYATFYADDNNDDDDDDDGETGASANEPVRLYIHCLIGEDLTAEEIEKEEELDNKQPLKSTSEAPRGFDRLLSQGFSQQDIFELRRQFVEIHGASLQSQSEDAVRDLEDRWIDSTVNNEIDEFTQTGVAGVTGGGGAMFREDGMNFDLLFSVCLGFLLGIFALLLLKLKVGNFDKKSEMAILFGVFVNLSYGCVKILS